MGFFDRRTVSVLLTVLIFAGVLALAWTARRPIIAFILAIFFAHLLEPLIGRFQAWLRVSRGAAVAITYGAFSLVLVLFGFTVGPHIAQQVQRLGQTLPELIENVKSGNIALQVGGRQGWNYQTQMRIQQWLVEPQRDIARYADGVTGSLGQVASNVGWTQVVPVLAGFLLNDRSALMS